MRKFIEITSDDDDHGGPGWKYGTCLWSPVAGQRGAKIYELMNEPSKDDLVINFYRERNKRYIHGQSYVDKTCYITTDNPSHSEWSWSDNFYRIDLKDFKKFKNPIPLKEFIDCFDIEIRHEYEETPLNYPFQVTYYKDPKFKKDSNVGLKNGKYLTESTSQLFNLISESKNTNSSSNKNNYLEPRRKKI